MSANKAFTPPTALLFPPFLPPAPDGKTIASLATFTPFHRKSFLVSHRDNGLQGIKNLGTQLQHAHVSMKDYSAPLSQFDELFLRLQYEFTILSAEEARVKALRDSLAAESSAVEAERVRVEQMRAKVDINRKVAAAQYRAAVEVQKYNEKKEAELRELARKLRIVEKAVREKEQKLPSSTTEGHAHDQPLRSPATSFPLSIKHNTLPGLHATVPAVAANHGPRLPSAEAPTLRRRSTIVQRTSISDLTLSGLSQVPVQGESEGQESVANKSGDAREDEKATEQSSQDRLARPRGRSIRRVSKSDNLRA